MYAEHSLLIINLHKQQAYTFILINFLISLNIGIFEQYTYHHQNFCTPTLDTNIFDIHVRKLILKRL